MFLVSTALPWSCSLLTFLTSSTHPQVQLLPTGLRPSKLSALDPAVPNAFRKSPFHHPTSDSEAVVSTLMSPSSVSHPDLGLKHLGPRSSEPHPLALNDSWLPPALIPMCVLFAPQHVLKFYWSIVDLQCCV